MPPRPKAILDALDAVSDDSGSGSGSGSDSEQEEQQAAQAQQQAAKKQKTSHITLEDLQAQGYSSGPSVLYMKPPEEEQPANWAWSDGREQKGQGDAEESYEERQRTHAAATDAADQGARLALKAAEQAARLREEAVKERAELQRQKKLSFSQKEKKKRDAGMQSRGKSTVEEEKRIARQYGVYSGFD